jgi:two-component system LytT family response regulator
MRLRVLIADDEVLVRKSIRRLLRDHDVEIVEECEDGRSALNAIRQRLPDLVFLDIQMPEINGMDVIKELNKERAPATIIVSAYANFAVASYEFDVVDYLLKPFNTERFEKAFTRACCRIGACSGLLPEQPLEKRPEAVPRMERLLESLLQRYEHQDRIPVPKNGRLSLIETNRIEWMEARGNTLLLHCENEVYHLRKALSEIQKQLDPRNFIRIHRSTIVNVRFVREIQPWFNGHHVLILKNGQKLRISRYRNEVMRQLIGSRSAEHTQRPHDRDY